jgi:hypothetical protein
VLEAKIASAPITASVFLRHVGLDLALLEHGLDHQFAALQVGVVGGGVDARQQGIHRFLRHAPFRHLLAPLLARRPCPCRPQPAWCRAAPPRCPPAPWHMAMPAPIMPAPSMPILVYFCGGTPAGREASLLASCMPKNSAADHVLRTGDITQVGEVARLDRQAGVEVGRQAFIDAGQDVLGRRVVVHRSSRAAWRWPPSASACRWAWRAATGNLEALGIPGLQPAWRRGVAAQHPLRAASRSVAGRHHGVDQADASAPRRP